MIVTQDQAIDAWAELNKEIDSLPPYLKDDDVTAQRFYDAHREQFISQNAARKWLEAKVRSGQLRKEKRRKDEAGNQPTIYVPV